MRRDQYKYKNADHVRCDVNQEDYLFFNESILSDIEEMRKCKFWNIQDLSFLERLQRKLLRLFPLKQQI